MPTVEWGLMNSILYIQATIIDSNYFALKGGLSRMRAANLSP